MWRTRASKRRRKTTKWNIYEMLFFRRKAYLKFKRLYFDCTNCLLINHLVVFVQYLIHDSRKKGNWSRKNCILSTSSSLSGHTCLDCIAHLCCEAVLLTLLYWHYFLFSIPSKRIWMTTAMSTIMLICFRNPFCVDC